MLNNLKFHSMRFHVTILILVEGSLQFINNVDMFFDIICHNPYFSRRFFAI